MKRFNQRQGETKMEQDGRERGREGWWVTTEEMTLRSRDWQ